jgi:Holliday junction resolvase RusA-like endonuclease
MTSWRAVITGNLVSKSNSRRLVHHGGIPRFVKSEAALAWTHSALQQLLGKKPPKPIEGDVWLDAAVYYSSRRPDLDVSLLQDVLQAAGIIKNDRQIVRLTADKLVDPANPRVLVAVMPA